MKIIFLIATKKEEEILMRIMILFFTTTKKLKVDNENESITEKVIGDDEIVIIKVNEEEALEVQDVDVEGFVNTNKLLNNHESHSELLNTIYISFLDLSLHKFFYFTDNLISIFRISWRKLSNLCQ